MLSLIQSWVCRTALSDSNKPKLGTHMLVSVHVLLDVELNDEEPGDGREHSSVNGSAVVGCRDWGRCHCDWGRWRAFISKCKCCGWMLVKCFCDWVRCFCDWVKCLCDWVKCLCDWVRCFGDWVKCFCDWVKCLCDWVRCFCDWVKCFGD